MLTLENIPEVEKERLEEVWQSFRSLERLRSKILKDKGLAVIDMQFALLDSNTIENQLALGNAWGDYNRVKAYFNERLDILGRKVINTQYSFMMAEKRPKREMAAV